MPFPYQTDVLAKTLSIDVADEEEEHKMVFYGRRDRAVYEIVSARRTARVQFKTNATYYIKLMSNLSWNVSFYGNWDSPGWLLRQRLWLQFGS
jgi:hypothetical protein